MKKRKNKSKLKYKIVEGMGLPRDLMLGETALQLIGHAQAYIENYKGIMEYTSMRIRIKTKDGCITIEGSNLCIAYYSAEEMKICGFISAVFYMLDESSAKC